MAQIATSHAISPAAREINDALPVPLAACLSPLGRRSVYPKGIPFQAGEARGKTYNGTIGQITDGAGGALPLPSLAAAVSGLEEDLRDRAVLYSPIDGLPELRRAWRGWQRREIDSAVPSSTPIVTLGLSHGLSLAADLFTGEGTAVAVAEPFWGNYRQTFSTRTGARLVTAPAYRDGVFDAAAPVKALSGLTAAEPAVVIVNFPSNPGGYSPTDDERLELIAALTAEAETRPLAVLCDDAYAGLVYSDRICRRSLFWDLIGIHPNLTPIKVDGATKELSFFGGRVGFLTFPFEPESPAAAALESKVKCLLRATVGSPVAASQAAVLSVLGSPRVAKEVEEVRALLAERAGVLAAALELCDRSVVRPLPFNSGCFALVELPEGVDAEEVRRHLLATADTGLISVGERFLRLAFCSVAVAALPELVRRMEAGVAAVAGR
ncbi:MAG: aminotransferase class I/II-fold pyridoxal phosphate-dependent enzyme [Acidobacteriota bacterium]